MPRTIVTGIDVGTGHVKVVIAEKSPQGERVPRILGVGTSESRGLRHGYITHQTEAVRSIEYAVAQAEKMAKVKVRKVFLSVGGVGLGSITANGSVIISRADSEITSLDLEKAQDACSQEIPSSYSINRKIIHAVPLSYKIDGKQVFGKPEGMKGNKLEVKMLFITSMEHHLHDLIQAVEDAGMEVEDVVASPIAASFVTLTKSQKIAGCVLANIGAETVSIAVFENNIPISLEVFPIGSTDITNDIALGLKVPLEEAEQIKIGAITGASYPRKKLEEIIMARMSDIFELIEVHLKKINRNGLLPAGVVLIGGSAGLNSIDEFAKNALKLPSRIGSLALGKEETKSLMRDSSWAVAYGLCVMGFSADEGSAIGTGARILKSAKKGIVSWVKQFLP